MTIYDWEDKTRGGVSVKIYAIHPNQPYPIHGAFYEDGEWEIQSWRFNGQPYEDHNQEDPLDLIPKSKPKKTKPKKSRPSIKALLDEIE